MEVIFIKSHQCLHGSGVSFINDRIAQGARVVSIVGDGQGGFLVTLEKPGRFPPHQR